ncbi:MAG: hypothetical protein GY943_04310 [Chloroflexi bacterium]|nr:hypothetical protein [Chloroflexota bacterium]
MVFKLILWMLDQSMRDLIVSELTEADYDISLINNQMLSHLEKGLENWGLLILDMEVLRQTNKAMLLLKKLRKTHECKVILLSRPDFYPLIRNNEFEAGQLTDHTLFFPLDKYELLENVKRYFRS